MIPIITVSCPICEATIECLCLSSSDGSLAIDVTTPLAAHIAAAHPNIQP